MKKSTKGAVAAAAGGVLLLGGAGTLAYWTEDVTIPGTAVESGHLEIANNTCGTATWELDNGGGTVTGATRIVPGDVITKTCSFDIDGEGDHFDNVTFSAGTPAWAASNALSSAIAIDDTYEVGGNPVGSTVDVGDTVDATISLTFDSATTGDTAEDLQATLNAITITATQNHTP
jgi:alternate signal-mediated exported protein